MFNDGLTVPDIAKERGLAESTIQGHLCPFIATGDLNINRLLSPERQSAIGAALDQAPENFLNVAKDKLGERYSYGEIKWMVSHRKHLSTPHSP